MAKEKIIFDLGQIADRIREKYNTEWKTKEEEVKPSNGNDLSGIAQRLREKQNPSVLNQENIVKGNIPTNGNGFDPEGSGYDYKTAEKYGITPDSSDHYPSREPNTGLILKGKNHPTFNKTLEGEEKAGYVVYKGSDGRYYSKPKEQPKEDILSKVQSAYKPSIQERNLNVEGIGETFPEQTVTAKPSKESLADYQLSKVSQSDLLPELEIKKKELESTPKTSPNYNKKVNEFNSLLATFNDPKVRERELLDIANSKIPQPEHLAPQEYDESGNFKGYYKWVEPFIKAKNNALSMKDHPLVKAVNELSDYFTKKRFGQETKSSDLVRGITDAASAALSTSLGIYPAVAGFELASSFLREPLINASVKRLGLDRKKSEFLIDTISPFVFGAKVGLASLAGKDLEFLVDKTIPEDWSEEDKQRAKSLANQVGFWGTIYGSHRFQQNVDIYNRLGALPTKGQWGAINKYRNEPETLNRLIKGWTGGSYKVENPELKKEKQPIIQGLIEDIKPQDLNKTVRGTETFAEQTAEPIKSSEIPKEELADRDELFNIVRGSNDEATARKIAVGLTNKQAKFIITSGREGEEVNQEVIDGILKPKVSEAQDVQIGSTEKILQRQPEETGISRGERGGMERGEQGSEITGTQQEIPQGTNETKITKGDEEVSEFENIFDIRLSETTGEKIKFIYDMNKEIVDNPQENEPDEVESAQKIVKEIDDYANKTPEEKLTEPLPSEQKPTEKLPQQPQKSEVAQLPVSTKKVYPAVRDNQGKIYTGVTHPKAIEKMLGKSEDEITEKEYFNTSDNVDFGFVNEKGKFLTQDETRKYLGRNEIETMDAKDLADENLIKEPNPVPEVKAVEPQKITDRIDKLNGVEKTYWDGKNLKLTVYYDEKIPKDVIQVRVAKELSDNALTDAVPKITFLSTEKGTFAEEPTKSEAPTPVVSEKVVETKVEKQPYELSKEEFVDKTAQEYYEKDKGEKTKYIKRGLTEKSAQIEKSKADKDYFIEPDELQKGRFKVGHKVSGDAEGLTLDQYKDKYQKDFETLHKNNVDFAVSEGKKVSPKILKDYPDLAEKPTSLISEPEKETPVNYAGIKNFEKEAVTKLQENRKILDKLFEERDQRRNQELSPNDKRSALRNINSSVSELRAKGINARYENDNLYIDDKKIYPITTKKAENLNQVVIDNKEAETPFEKLTPEEQDRQTFLSDVISQKKFLPEELKRMLPVGFGQEKIDNAVKDIKEDGGKEQNRDAKIYRDFIKSVDDIFTRDGYITFTDGSKFTKEQYDNELEDYVYQRAKQQTDFEDDTFDFSLQDAIKNEEIDETTARELSLEQTPAEREELVKSIESEATSDNEVKLNEAVRKADEVVKPKKPSFLKPPKGSNAVIVKFKDGKQSKLPINDLSLIGNDYSKVDNISFGSVDFNKSGGLKWDSFKEIKNVNPNDQILKQDLDRTELQSLQDRKRHLELVLSETKDNEVIKKGQVELKDINNKLSKIRTKENQFDMFGDKQDQMSLFQKEHTRTRNVFEKMNDVEQQKFLRIVANGFLSENPDIKFGNVPKTSGRLASAIANITRQSILFDSRTSDMLTAIEEINHIVLSNPDMVSEWRAKAILRENGWDGRGDYREPNNNKTLEDAYENFADKNKEWYSKNKEATPKTLTEKFIVWLKNLWAKLAGYLHSKGFYTQAGFFENLYTGKLKQMGLKEQTERINEIRVENALAQKVEQTSSPEFKEFFGKSEVVDAKKNPLIVYHGTTGDFNTFEKGDVGFHFGSSDQANQRTMPIVKSGRKPLVRHEVMNGVKTIAQVTSEGANIIAAYIRLENPLRIRDNALTSPKDYAGAIIEEANRGNFDNKVANYIYANVERMLGSNYSLGSVKTKEAFDFIRDTLKGKGYDGLIYQNEYEDKEVKSDSYVVFDANQIKSAIGNSGEFSKSDNILKQKLEKINPELTQTLMQSLPDETNPMLQKGLEIFNLGKTKFTDWQKAMKEDFGKQNYQRLYLDVLKAKRSDKELLSSEVKEEESRLEKGTERLESKIEDPGYLEYKRQRTNIKNQIKEFKRGWEAGKRDTEQELTFLKKLIRDYAQEYLPKNLIKSEITPLMTKLAEAKKLEDVEEGFNRIDKIVLHNNKNYLLKNIYGALQTFRPEKVKGVLKGKHLTAPEYDQLSDIRKIVSLKPDQVNELTTKLFERIETAGDDFDEAAEEYLYRIQTFSNLKEKSVEELSKVLDDLTEIIATGKTKHQLILEAKREKRKVLIDEFEKLITGGKGLLSEEEARAKGLDLQKHESFIKKFDLNNQSLEWLFDNLSKFDKDSKPLEGALNKYFIPKVQESRNNENEGTTNYFKEIHDKAEDVFGVKGRKLVSLLNKNTEREKTGIFVKKGENKIELELSQNEAYKKWMEWQDPSLKPTLEKMGWNEGVIKQIEKWLKPEVKKWAEWQIKEFYPKYYKTVNDVFSKMFYVNLPFNEYYSPVQRSAEGKDNYDDQLLRNKTQYASVMNGHLMSRVKNTRDLKIIDGDITLANHLIVMEHFKNWAETVKEMRSVLQSEKIQKAILQYHGKTAQSILNGFINDLARGGEDRALVVNFLDKLRGGFSKAVLGANPVIMLKQFSSMPAFVGEIPIRDFAKGLTYFFLNPGKALGELSESKMMKHRYHRGWERDVIQALKRSVSKQMANTKNFTDNLMIFIELGDKAASHVGGYGVYRYYKDKYLREGKSPEEAKRQALLQFELSVGRTQQKGDTEDLSAIQRLGSFGKLFTMFQTQPNAYYRQMSNNVRNFYRGRGRTNAAKRIFVYHFLLPFIFQWVASGLPGLLSNWDDKDKKRQLRALALGSFNGMLAIGNLIEDGIDFIIGDMKQYNPQMTPILQPIIQFGYMAKNIAKLIDGTTTLSTNEVLKIVDEIVSVVGKAKGIPYDPIKRTIKGAKNIYEQGGVKSSEDILKTIGYSDYALGNDKEKGIKKSNINQKQLFKLPNFSKELQDKLKIKF